MAVAQSARQVDAGVTHRCELLITNLRAAAPQTAAEQEAIAMRKLELEAGLAQSVEGRYQVTRATRVEFIQVFDRTALLLARGETQELVSLLTPFFKPAADSFKTLKRTSAQMTEELAKNRPNRRRLAELDYEFQTASRTYGEVYGGFKSLFSLLISVSLGRGADETTEIILQRSTFEQPVFIDLLLPISRATALEVLRILHPRMDDSWMPNIARDEDGESVDLREYKTMFRFNVYALIAKLERDMREEREANAEWRTVLNYVSNFWVGASDQKWIPEWARKAFLTVMGLTYDRMMLERHLGKIQAVINVSLNRAPDGKLVLSTDAETLHLQLTLLKELSSSTRGTDLLVTFARISYPMEVWTNLMREVDRKAKDTASYTDQYVHFAVQMRDAEKRAKEMGSLSTIYPSAVKHQVIFASVQLIWGVAGEEAIRQGLLPLMQNWF